MSDLSHVLYLSSAAHLMEPRELSELLESSQRNNERDGITGMMLYDGGSIIQYLEGPADRLAATWSRIQRDSRHKGVLVASEGPTTERLFSDWNMGFENGERIGGFNMDWRAMQERVPDEFPMMVRTMMRVFYSAGRNPSP